MNRLVACWNYQWRWDLKQEWNQSEPLLQSLTDSSNNNIPPWRIDGICDLIKAVMRSLSFTLVAVPIISMYQAPALLISVHIMFAENCSERYRKECRVYFSGKYLDSHDINLGSLCALRLIVGMSEDAPARSRGFALLKGDANYR